MWRGPSWAFVGLFVAAVLAGWSLTGRLPTAFDVYQFLPAMAFIALASCVAAAVLWPRTFQILDAGLELGGWTRKSRHVYPWNELALLSERGRRILLHHPPSRQVLFVRKAALTRDEQAAVLARVARVES
jgi:hypothetical protein